MRLEGRLAAAFRLVMHVQSALGTVEPVELHDELARRALLAQVYALERSLHLVAQRLGALAAPLPLERCPHCGWQNRLHDGRCARCLDPCEAPRDSADSRAVSGRR
jgi:hypothetical protein